MTDRCATCQTQGSDRGAYEGLNGEPLCGACYFAIWGPSGAAEISRAVELLTPAEPPRPRRWPR